MAQSGSSVNRDLSAAQIILRIADGPEDQFQVIRYRGTEGLCQLYRFEIEVASSEDGLGIESMEGKPAVLVAAAGTGARAFHGIVAAFEVTGETTDLTYYRVELVPALWLLTHRYNSQIFQDMPVKEIITAVVTAAGIVTDRIRFDLRGSYDPRAYCVQYRETDYNFICRLMEDEGMWWYFEQPKPVAESGDDSGGSDDGGGGPESDTLVIADSEQAYEKIDPPPDGVDTGCAPDELPYKPPTGLNTSMEHVFRYRLGRAVRPGKVLLNDFNFEKPGLNLWSEGDGKRDPALEFCDYPGGFDSQGHGVDRAKIRTQEFETSRTVGIGMGNSHRLLPGRTFKLVEHPNATLNDAYLVTRITHYGRQAIARTTADPSGGLKNGDLTAHRNRSEWLYHGGQVARDLSTVAAAMGANPMDALTIPNLLEDGHAGTVREGEGQLYECRFECIPAGVTYRPPRVTPWPVMRGCQTAKVVGEGGDDSEEIVTDKYGRVKVLFNWDRRGHSGKGQSCWVRVAQGFAGAGYGMFFLPRIGHEVIVDFLEGNPDKPVVTGCLYNQNHMPPYTLPGEKTKSTIKTNSSLGGSGFNELRFEDLKDKEQIFLHAQKDYDIHVENDAKEWIGNDRHLIVTNDLFEKIENNKHAIVKADLMQQVDGNASLTVAGDLAELISGDASQDVTGDLKTKVDGDIGFKGGKNIVLEAGMSLTIKAGSNFINIGPAGIAIKGLQILLNSGGSPGGPPAPPAAPDAPGEPLEADNAEPGKEKVEWPAGPPTPQAQALTQAANTGAPFCEICEAAEEQQAGDETGAGDSGGAGGGGSAPS